MSIRGFLLASAALCTLSAASALANAAPDIHVVAAHAGGFAHKTAMHHDGAGHVTYTISVTTAVSTHYHYKAKTNLRKTFYTWESNNSICYTPKKQKVTLSTKKTAYAKIGTTTMAFSYSCPTTLYGDTYTLETTKAVGTTDIFTSELSAKFKNGGYEYKGRLFLDVAVSIER